MKNIANHDLKRIIELGTSWNLPMLFYREDGVYAYVPAGKENAFAGKKQKDYPAADIKDMPNHEVFAVEWHGDINTMRTVRGKLKKTPLARTSFVLDENTNCLQFTAKE